MLRILSALVVSMLVRGLHSRTGARMGIHWAETTWKKSVNGTWVALQPPAPMGAITAASSATWAYAKDAIVEASGSQGSSSPANAAAGAYFSA